MESVVSLGGQVKQMCRHLQSLAHTYIQALRNGQTQNTAAGLLRAAEAGSDVDHCKSSKVVTDDQLPEPDLMHLVFT